MGADKFQEQLRIFGALVDHDTCSHIIKTYRLRNSRIAGWWNNLNTVLYAMTTQKTCTVDAVGLMHLSPFTGIELPNGLFINYPNLTKTVGGYEYKTRSGNKRIYGGKVAENLCQAVARCVIGEQILQIEKRYRVVLTVHDAIACIVPEQEATEARAYIEQCMRTPPAWATGLPLNCESGMAHNYGEC